MLDATPWRFGRALLCFLLFSTANAMKRREADGSPFDPLVFDPCAFPQLTDGVRCGIYIPHGQVCDPYSMMSVSELKLLGGVMEGFKKTKEDEDPAGNLQCRAFEFGIVFLNEIRPLWNRSLAGFDREFCPPLEFEPPDSKDSPANNPRDFTHFAQEYARLVRERSMQTGGDCDLLILVVKEPPQRAPDHVHRPQIFVSVGPLVAELFAYSNQGVFAEIANETNVELQSGYPISSALSRFMKTAGGLIEERTQTPQPKNHVPLWAHGTFAVCGLLMLVMAGILYLLRTTHPRVRSKFNGADPARRWKAGGFVGDENQNNVTTYVNLVQILRRQMTGDKQPANTQQQV